MRPTSPPPAVSHAFCCGRFLEQFCQRSGVGLLVDSERYTMKVTIAPDFRDLFRALTPEEFEQAKANNQTDPDHERIPPVVVWDGIIIDGHHTHRIRESLRTADGKPVKIRYLKMEFPDRQAAMAYAIHAQIGRRNLDASQIAMAIAKLPKGTPGRPAEKNRDKFDPISQPSRADLAEEAGIGRTTMKHADKVTEQGAAAVQAAVVAGDVSVSDAAAIVDLPKTEQAKAVKAVKEGKAKTLKGAAKGKAKPDATDYGKCPNCAGTKWTEDEDGVVCAKCKHPHGEPTGGADEDRIATQRSKTVKTVEALQRAFDDLNLLLPKADHKQAAETCKVLLRMARGWK